MMIKHKDDARLTSRFSHLSSRQSLAQSTTQAADTGGGGGTRGSPLSPTRDGGGGGGGQCIWYGVCNNETALTSQYCTYDGPAKPASDQTKDLLKVWCKHLLADEDGTGAIDTCCDAEQVSLAD